MSTSAVLEEQSVAVTCRATEGQFCATTKQINLIRRFLRVGNSAEFQMLKHGVLKKVFPSGEFWKQNWWNQTLIFLALKLMCPDGLELKAFSKIEALLEAMSSDADFLEKFLEAVGVNISPSLFENTSDSAVEHWLPHKDVLERFFASRIKRFVPNYWAYLGYIEH